MKWILPFWLAILLSPGCRKSTTSIPSRTSVPIKYASGFEIEYLSDGRKKVTDGEGHELILVPQEREVAGYDYIKVPVERVVCLSSTSVSCLRALGVLGSVVGVHLRKDRWYIDEIKKGMEEGKIEVVGKGMEEPNYEKILALKPDVVFTYTGLPTAVRAFRKFEEMGVPVAVDNGWLESHPLGRLEWIKFLAAFYDKEDEATEFFEKVENKVKEIHQKVASIEQEPVVLWGSIWKGKCYVPAGGSYAARMISIAGGNYIFRDLEGAGNVNVTLEEFYLRGMEADVFIYSFYPPYVSSTIKGLVEANPILADIEPVKEGKVYCFQPWYYQSVDRTDEIIQDLAAIFHPQLFPNHKLRYFMKLHRG